MGHLRDNDMARKSVRRTVNILSLSRYYSTSTPGFIKETENTLQFIKETEKRNLFWTHVCILLIQYIFLESPYCWTKENRANLCVFFSKTMNG